MVVFNVNTRAPESNTLRASALDFDDYRARAGAFSRMAGHVGTGFTFSGDGDPELVIGQQVTPISSRCSAWLRRSARTFTADEFTPGRDRVVVLAHRLWQRRFGGLPAIVGSRVTLNGRPFTVAGVMPPGFSYPAPRYELWTPLPSPRTPDMPPIHRSADYLQIVGRLKDGVSPARANVELRAIAASLASEYPDTNDNLSARAVSLPEFSVRDVRTPLYVLLAAVGLVTLIACASVTSLLLARGAARQREVAVRRALGAARWRLVRQFLVETVLLDALGAAGALALASWGMPGDRRVRPVRYSASGRGVARRPHPHRHGAAVAGGRAGVRDCSSGPRGKRGPGGGAARRRPRDQQRRAAAVPCRARRRRGRAGGGAAHRRRPGAPQLRPPDLGRSRLRCRRSAHLLRRPVRAALRDCRVDDPGRGSDRRTALRDPRVLAVGATTHLPLSGQNMENGFSVEGYTPPPGADNPIGACAA